MGDLPIGLILIVYLDTWLLHFSFSIRNEKLLKYMIVFLSSPLQFLVDNNKINVKFTKKRTSFEKLPEQERFTKHQQENSINDSSAFSISPTSSNNVLRKTSTPPASVISSLICGSTDKLIKACAAPSSH